MGNDASSLEIRLAKLKVAFLGRMPQRFAVIQPLWSALKAGKADAGTCEELRREVHSLIGSSASFDFPEISQAAREMSAALKALDGLKPTPTTVQRVDVCLQHLLLSIAEASGEEPSSLLAEDVSPKQISRLVYLLGDDELAIRQLSLQLEKGGLDTRCFSHTSALKDALDEQLPGALVMNATWPEGGSVDAESVAALRRQHALPLPIILISERVDMAARLAAIRAGADGFLAAPVDVTALQVQLNELIGEGAEAEARILIVEDDPDQLALTVEVLKDYGFSVMGLSDGTDIEGVMTDFDPDLLLLDLYMPHVDGNELAALVRLYPQWQNLPVLFLSSEADPAVQMSTLRHGGDDFLRKPVAPDLLVEAVRLHLKRSRRRGQVLATQSAPVPTGPHERLLEWLDRTEDAVLLFLEPAMSDWTLTLSGKADQLSRLQRTVAKHFQCEEPLNYGTGIVVVLGGMDAERLHRAGEDLRDMAHDAGLPNSAVGMALSDGSLSSEHLIESAGVAVQAARRGSGVHLAVTTVEDAAYDETESQLLSFEQMLQAANLSLLFQPTISLQGLPVEYHEVLARLHLEGQPEGLPPSQFSELMGAGTLGKLLDRKVLDLALSTLKRVDATADSGRLIVKLSLASLHDPELALWVLDTLKAHGLSGNKLCLSMDTTAAGSSLEVALPQLQQLSRLGCVFCLEGFPGRGHGAALLQTLKPRCVKLQRGLLYGIKTAEERRTALTKMMGLIRDAGAQVLVSFVEDAETLSVLYQCGADFAQGYFVQPPVDSEAYAFATECEEL